MRGMIWNAWQDMRGGNDSLVMAEGKTVQADKPEVEFKDSGKIQGICLY